MKLRGLFVFAGDPPRDSVSVPIDLLPVGVLFFRSLPSMGVMLFPSFVLGNVSGEAGTLFVPLFLFSPLLPLLLLFQFLFLFSLFLLILFSISFTFPFSSFSSLEVFFLRELLVLFVFEM